MGSPDQDRLSFMLMANPNNPNRGILARLPGFYIPILDVPFNGATPPNSPYPTTIYTAQYDGIGNAPQYPLNAMSTLNGFMGPFYIHGQYPDFTSPQVANAVRLPTSPGYTGNTEYYMILTQICRCCSRFVTSPLSVLRSPTYSSPMCGCSSIWAIRPTGPGSAMRIFRLLPRCYRYPTPSPSFPIWRQGPCKDPKPVGGYWFVATVLYAERLPVSSVHQPGSEFLPGSADGDSAICAGWCGRGRAGADSAGVN